MPTHLPLRILLGAIVLVCLFACEESDVLYGESIDDYTLSGPPKDAAALQYFQAKEVACVTSKSSLRASHPTTYVSVDLIVRRPDGQIEQLPTRQTFARLRPYYESDDGGFMGVSVVNRLGYSRSFTLYPCNDKETYFYVATYSADGSALQEVAAYSLPSNRLPLAYELGYEHHDVHRNSLAKYRVIGLAIRTGQVGESSLHRLLGNTGYLGYLLRRHRCGSPAEYGYSSPPEYYVDQTSVLVSCGGVTLNGTAVHTVSLDDRLQGGKAPGIHLFNDRSSEFLARFADGAQTYSQERRVRIKVVQSGRALYAYDAWVWLGIPYSSQITIAM
jgi:hypothetical protein